MVWITFTTGRLNTEKAQEYSTMANLQLGCLHCVHIKMATRVGKGENGFIKGCIVAD